MGRLDIHWYVQESMRGQGHLHRALHSCILPHIFADGRQSTMATADSDANVRYLERQGFVYTNHAQRQRLYTLDATSVAKFDCKGVSRKLLSKDAVKQVSKELYRIAAELRALRDKLECSTDNDFYIDSHAYDLQQIGQELSLDFDELRVKETNKLP